MNIAYPQDILSNINRAKTGLFGTDPDICRGQSDGLIDKLIGYHQIKIMNQNIRLCQRY